MKKRSEDERLSVEPLDEPDVTGLINKVLQQLGGLEKKLDILISQSSKKPFEKSYSQKPSRSPDHPFRRDRGRQDSGPRGGSFTRVICADCKKECEVPFKPTGDRPVYCRECFPRHKESNPVNGNRNDRSAGRGFNRERRFDKRPTGKARDPSRKRNRFPQSGRRDRPR